MTDPFTVLLVEDDLADARLVEEMLNEARDDFHRVRVGAGEPASAVSIRHAETLDRGLEHLDGGAVDVVLLDPDLPDSTGLETVEAVLERADRVPVVVLTGVPEDELGIEAVRAGARDYLAKDAVTSDVLVRTIRYATERGATERELRRRNERLVVLNRLLRHDVRNDVSLVVGRAGELADHVDEEGQDLLNEVMAAGNHVLQLTRTVGDSLEAVADGDDAVIAPVDLRRILRGEIETARRLYDPGTVVVEGGIPAVEVRANRLLSSVFGNLFGNAMLYNDAEEPEVRVGVEVNAETVTVRVADDGPGVPARRIDDVFERGVRGEEGGTGTGLYVVDRLVREYGGDVSARNTETGAEFSVTLRRA